MRDRLHHESGHGDLFSQAPRQPPQGYVEPGLDAVTDQVDGRADSDRRSLHAKVVTHRRKVLRGGGREVAVD
jgi:hypothetical protein